jgi:hypothetical protein
VHILIAGGSKDVDQACLVHGSADQRRGKGDVIQDAREVTGGFRMPPFLLDDEAVQGDYSLDHMTLPRSKSIFGRPLKMQRRLSLR